MQMIMERRVVVENAVWSVGAAKRCRAGMAMALPMRV